MKYKNFVLRLCNLLLVLALLGIYQTALYVRGQEEQMVEMETEINQLTGENEALRASVSGNGASSANAASSGNADSTDTSDEDGDSSSTSYKDGAYSGTAEGFGGNIEVSVDISGGKITSVEIVSADGEDEAYLSLAEGLIDDIIEQQTADVDSVSGATYSSGGIKGAVEDALSEAVE